MKYLEEARKKADISVADKFYIEYQEKLFSGEEMTKSELKSGIMYLCKVLKKFYGMVSTFIYFL